jgi:hypothetical protein
MKRRRLGDTPNFVVLFPKSRPVGCGVEPSFYIALRVGIHEVYKRIDLVFGKGGNQTVRQR